MVMDRSEIPITAHNILERKVIDELFKKLEAAELRETYTTISMKELADSVLTGDKLLAHKQNLDELMQSRKEYLRPDLTLPKLAEAVGCSVNNLSQVINSGFGTSFFDYLNRYRIEHARKLLKNSDGQSSAILHTAFTVGFNSNSAFYSAFKKHVGMTPAQYRQKHLKRCH